MTIGIVVFPGSNCDFDIMRALTEDIGVEARYLWHKETSLADVDSVVLPGGFSYGDYLRTGAIARFSPIMTSIVEFARGGGPVLGICNGFQILVEAGLLPGALTANRSLRFICRDVHVRTDGYRSPLSSALGMGQVLQLPIAHHGGNYYADEDDIEILEAEGRIALRYCDREGNVTEASNPNGSLANIAAITSSNGRVLGMMPHPERCAAAVLGNTDGLKLLKAWIER